MAKTCSEREVNTEAAHTEDALFPTQPHHHFRQRGGLHSDSGQFPCAGNSDHDRIAACLANGMN
jgi:hypothetical protein